MLQGFCAAQVFDKQAHALPNLATVFRFYYTYLSYFVTYSSVLKKTYNFLRIMFQYLSTKSPRMRVVIFALDPGHVVYNMLLK